MRNNAIYLTLITKYSSSGKYLLLTEKNTLIELTEKCIKSIRKLGKFNGTILLFTDLRDSLEIFKAYDVDIINVDDTIMKDINYAPVFARLLVDKIFNFNIFDKVLYLDGDILVLDDLKTVFDQINGDYLYYVIEKNMLADNEWCNLNFTPEEIEKYKLHDGINSGTYGCFGKNLSQYMEVWRKETNCDYCNQKNQPFFNSMIFRKKLSAKKLENAVKFPHASLYDNCPMIHFCGKKDDERMRDWKMFVDDAFLATNREQGWSYDCGLEHMSTWLCKLNKISPIKTAVDFGCGAGKMGKMLKGTLKLDKLIGVDIWTPTLVSRQLDNPKIYDEVYNFDIRNLLNEKTPFDNYDLWFFGNVFECIEENIVGNILCSSKPKYIAARVCVGTWEKGTSYTNEAEKHLWDFYPSKLNNILPIKNIKNIETVTDHYVSINHNIPEIIEGINHYINYYEKLYKAYISNFILSKK